MRPRQFRAVPRDGALAVRISHPADDFRTAASHQYPGLTVLENVEFRPEAQGVPRAERRKQAPPLTSSTRMASLCLNARVAIPRRSICTPTLSAKPVRASAPKKARKAEKGFKRHAPPDLPRLSWVRRSSSLADAVLAQYEPASQSNLSSVIG